MELCYRGVSHNDSSLSLEVKEGEIGGKYRGQEWKVLYPRHVPVLKTKVYRQYRGIAYSCTPVVNASTPDLKESSYYEVIFQSKESSPNLNQIHQENLYHSVERRLNKALEQGDHKLVAILQQEYQQLGLVPRSNPNRIKPE